jgi:hypothetical protein
MRGILSNSLLKSLIVFIAAIGKISFFAATVVVTTFDAEVAGVGTRILAIRTWVDRNAKPFLLFWDEKLLRAKCITRRSE